MGLPLHKYYGTNVSHLASTAAVICALRPVLILVDAHRVQVEVRVEVVTPHLSEVGHKVVQGLKGEKQTLDIFKESINRLT